MRLLTLAVVLFAMVSDTESFEQRGPWWRFWRVSRHFYVAASLAGTGDGTNCANAKALTFFSTAGNWGNGAGKIGPGTTVHVCGTITGSAGGTAFNFLGNGSSGSPVKLLFEPGASLTNADYWGNNTAGAIYVVNRSWVTIDCAGGTISNSGNGSGLTNQAISNGIYGSGASNVTVQNCVVSNIYQHTSTTDTDADAQSSTGINFQSSSNIRITANTIDDAGVCLFVGFAAGDTNISLTNNTGTRCNWGIGVGARGASTSLDGVTITGNTISSATNWDTTTDAFHHNGVFLYAAATTTISDVVMANNYIYDMAGGCVVTLGIGGSGCETAHIFLARNTGTIDAVHIYNNLLVEATGPDGPANGFILPDGTNYVIANNTIVSNGKSACITVQAFTLASASVIKNNICSMLNQGQIWGGSNGASFTIAASDTNIFYSIAHATIKFGYNPSVTYTAYASLALWTAGTTFDANSLTSDPQLTGTYRLVVGSPARGAGENLTSLGITGLTTDRDGVARPPVAAWDIGAYQYTP